MSDHAPVGVVKSHRRQCLDAGHRRCIQTRRDGQLRQRGLRGDRAALFAMPPQHPQHRAGDGRDAVQPGIVAPVARQHRHRDAPPPRQILHRSQPIRPPRLAADQADQDAPRPRQRVFDVGIDRNRMLQGHQIAEPRGRQTARRAPPALGERAQVAVRKGQDHQIRRRLAGVIGGGGLFQPDLFAEDDVHQAGAPASTARIASALI